MILERTLMAVTAAAAIAAAAVVAVVAAAFALFAVLRDWIGPAGASAVVAAVFASGALAAALYAARRARDEGDDEDEDADGLDFLGPGMLARVGEMARERPVMAVGAALAAGVLAFKNPQLVATVARAFLEPKSPPRADPPADKRRRKR